MRCVLFIVAACSLVGCAEMQRIGAKAEAQARAEDRAQCESYGYTPGTDAFADCMMTTEHRRQEQQLANEREVEAAARGEGGAPVDGGDTGDTHCKTTSTTTQTGDSETTQSKTVCHN